MQKVIYTAGPFRAVTRLDELRNIEIAESWALAVWKAGHIALCPHANSANFSTYLDGEAFLRGDLELLARCDAVLMIPRWEESRGALIEKTVAELLGIPVFLWNNPEGFAEFLDGEE